MSTNPEALATPTFVARKTCRGCGTTALVSVLDLGVQFLPRFVPEEDSSLPKAPLHLVRCASCGLLQLLHTTNPDLLYREFWYRSGINASMKSALREVVDEGVRWHLIGSWLDIGANDGYLLSAVPPEFKKVACEPARNFKAELEEQADDVLLDYFSAKGLNNEKFEVITSAAMFYDVDEPGAFLDDIHASLKPGGVWINQLNDAPTMMKANAFDSICHEHLCYYDVPTLAALYLLHGLVIVGISFNEVNGGSVRVVAKREGDVQDWERASILGLTQVTQRDAEAFAKRIAKWADVFGELVSSLGPNLWCYGASTKGSTLLQYLDMREYFAAVADRNPKKHGLKMVGSWLPIVGEDAMREARPRYAVVLPWAFKKEFTAREALTRAEGTSFIYPLPNPEIVL